MREAGPERTLRERERVVGGEQRRRLLRDGRVTADKTPQKKHKHSFKLPHFSVEFGSVHQVFERVWCGVAWTPNVAGSILRTESFMQLYINN